MRAFVFLHTCIRVYVDSDVSWTSKNVFLETSMISEKSHSGQMIESWFANQEDAGSSSMSLTWMSAGFSPDGTQ